MNQQYESIKLYDNFTIDFNKLALLEPALRENVIILNNRIVWNFSNQHSLIKLTQAIMKHIFRVNWACPLTNLCPRIPSRINYLLWLSINISDSINKVLDVGTGATLIYPLLGWSLYKWKFIAIEINKQSYQSSKGIIQSNKLGEQIDLRLSKVQDLQTILHPIIKEDEAISVVICNPPFFEEESATLSVMEKQEHHIECGEYGFFFVLYKDSFRFKNIKHFSCLVGRATDFQDIKKFLIEENKQGFLKILKFGEIIQGRNKRFIVLWSIDDSTRLVP